MKPSTVLPIYRDYANYSDWTDDSPVDGAREYSASEIIAFVVFSVVFLVGVPGNAVVVWVTGIEARKVVNGVWFLNLAVADLLCCLVLPLLAVPIVRYDDWPFTEAACRFLPSVILLNMYASVLLLTAISIDRCLLVMKPIWCQNHRSVPMARAACFLAWTLALVLTIPSLIYRELKEEDFPPSWHCMVHYEQKTVEFIVAIFRFLLSFLGPLVIISVCYWLLLNRLWSRQATRSLKTVKVVLAVVAGFFICWTPYQIVGLVEAASLSGSELYSWAKKIDSLTISLTYINSCINPIIYVVAGHGIKDRMTSYFICTSLRKVLIEDSVGRDSKSFSRSTMASTMGPEEQL
ncbi:C5a anaphylatoxin chemotactic receptor 1 [Phascolarctos cinereus]|uniref:C5a anaphylatoxin chemotactic receptor 1 n=1 Tax=Phascolarctos cinereus TaxID=38626 RepID=A0A6P5JIN5_PHACI|nr:C5a anaphylatoxin chemotactic receptor 1 [Phascolarctos cinereus]